MSCSSCGGCFTGTSCSTSKHANKEVVDESERFQFLLDVAMAQQQPTEQHKMHDHVIPTIMSELSKNIYASQTVLFQAFDELEFSQFLDLARCLYATKILGVHIAWAAEYCKGDPRQLLKILSTGNEEEKSMLLQHCDNQAEIYEIFSR